MKMVQPKILSTSFKKLLGIFLPNFIQAQPKKFIKFIKKKLFEKFSPNFYQTVIYTYHIFDINFCPDRLLV